MIDTKNILTVQNLAMHFGGIRALEDVNLNVKKSSITSLIGPNGAGKTTLFNCLTGFYKASSGKIIFKPSEQDINLIQLLGEPLTWLHCCNFKTLFTCLYYKMFGGSHLVSRSGIARTFQNIRLFKEMTVIENMLVAQHVFAYRNLIGGLIKTQRYQQWENRAIKIAYDWLDQFNLATSANKLAGELSYGQQRYLEMARCMCTQPRLLCLDEPAAGLNPIETEKLGVLIKQIKKDHNLTILLIEHDMNMVMYISDTIFVLDQGKIICSGSPQKIRQDKHVIAAYLGIE